MNTTGEAAGARHDGGGVLHRRVAIVTGAAGGIGRAIAETFAQEGASVTIVDLDGAGAAATADALADRGHDAHAAQADLTVPEQVESMAADVLARHGHIDILINNAGGGTPSRPVDMPPDDWDIDLDRNLKTTFLATRAVWSTFVRQGHGVIVNAASIAGRQAMPGLVTYCTAKAAILMYTRCLALEGGRHGIRANAVVPGTVRTPMLETFIEQQPDPDRTRAEFSSNPLKRMATPREIAQAYLYLASDASSFVNGAELVVDGGAIAVLST